MDAHFESSSSESSDSSGSGFLAACFFALPFLDFLVSAGLALGAGFSSSSSSDSDSDSSSF